MANAGDILGIVGTATAINAVSVTSKGEPEAAFGIVFGGLAMFTTLAGLGQFYDWRLARNFAWLFLLATLLFRGEAFFTWMNLALSSTKTATYEPNQVPQKSRKTGAR